MVKFTKVLSLITVIFSLAGTIVVLVDYFKLRKKMELPSIFKKREETESLCETETPTFDDNEDIAF